LTLQPEIAQAMVFGDRRPHLVAILVPDPDFAAQVAGRSKELATLTDHPELAKALGEAVARVNAGLPAIERVRRFIVAREAFTTANGQMTPTLKVKRHAVRAMYGSALEALYEGKSAAA